MRTLILVMTLLMTSPVLAIDIFVNPDGRDDNPGSFEKPIASLTVARDLVRSLLSQGISDQITVNIGAGTYRLQKPLEFGPADSGKTGQPVVWRGSGGANPRITGTVKIAALKMVMDSSILDKIPESSRSLVREFDFSEWKNNIGVAQPRGYWLPSVVDQGELFLDGKRLKLARWPNAGFIEIVNVSNGVEFSVRSSNIPHISDEQHAFVGGYLTEDWADVIVPIRESRDGVFKVPDGLMKFPLKEGQPAFLLNVLSGLDEPGEYFLDLERGVGFVIVKKNMDFNSLELSVAESLINVKGAHDITFEYLQLDGVRGSAVNFTNVMNVQLNNCLVKNPNGWGAIITGYSSGVSGCKFVDMGEGGVRLTGGDRRDLAEGKLFVRNNVIAGFGQRVGSYRAAVELRGVGQMVIGNTIYDGPHVAVHFSGNNHRIEQNNIKDVVKEADDMGAIYTGRDWSARGTKIQFNYISNVRSKGKRGARGVYLDDFASGTTVQYNIFADVQNAIFVGGGRDNFVGDNFLFRCRPSIHFDARGIEWTSIPNEEIINPTEILKQIPYQSDVYRSQYPELSSLLDDEPRKPKGNKFLRNVFVASTAPDISEQAHAFVSMDFKFISQEELNKIDDNKIGSNYSFQDVIALLKIIKPELFDKVSSMRIGASFDLQ